MGKPFAPFVPVMELETPILIVGADRLPGPLRAVVDDQHGYLLFAYAFKFLPLQRMQQAVETGRSAIGASTDDQAFHDYPFPVVLTDRRIRLKRASVISRAVRAQDFG